MESRIPLPTDNVYKFYALFGLALIVSTIAAFLYLHTTTNALAFEATIEYEELDSKDQPTAVELKKKEVLEKRVKIAVQDKETYTTVLGLIFALGVVGAGYGFSRWHLHVQPKLDRLLDLQIAKAEQETQTKRKPFRAPT